MSDRWYTRLTLSGGATATLLEAHLSHALSDTTLVDKIALQAPDLLVEEIVGLVNETNRDIRHNFSGTCLTEFSEIVICRVRFRCRPTERKGHIIHHLRFLIRKQLPVISVRQDKSWALPFHIARSHKSHESHRSH